MKYYFNIGLITACFAMLFASLPAFGNNDIPKKNDKIANKGTYYVLAPFGLELKASSHRRSPVIRKIPYGGKVILIKHATTINWEIDQIDHGMAEVTYNGKKGFVFECYLSRFPAPKGNMNDVYAYSKKLREVKINTYFEVTRKDWSKKKFDVDEKFLLPAENWTVAFLIARNLFKIPERYFAPKPWKEPRLEKIIENPDKTEESSVDELRLKYSVEGFLNSIEYEVNTEGERQLISLTIDTEGKGIWIRQQQKVDID